jgi:DNA-binding transcriptional ArsR family regulator
MTDSNRGLINYTSRDYQTLMQEFWTLVPTLTNLWKPEADADPGVVLGKVLASAADALGVNVDYLANELFASSVVQRKDAEKILGKSHATVSRYLGRLEEIDIIEKIGSFKGAYYKRK